MLSCRLSLTLERRAVGKIVHFLLLFYINPRLKYRQYEMGECTRAGFCNFMHLKVIFYIGERGAFCKIKTSRVVGTG